MLSDLNAIDMTLAAKAIYFEVVGFIVKAKVVSFMAFSFFTQVIVIVVVIETV